MHLYYILFVNFALSKNDVTLFVNFLDTNTNFTRYSKFSPKRVFVLHL